MSNLQRIFYATHGVNLGGAQLKGVQSVSLTSNFNLEPVFQLSQLSQIEMSPTTAPEVEVTITRALLDGPAFSIDVNDSNVTVIEQSLLTPTSLSIGIVGGGGFSVPEAYISSYSVNFTTDGIFTEELSYVANGITLGGAINSLSDNNVHAPRRQDFTGLANATSATFSATFNRDSVYRLGEFRPFLRSVTFPIECTLQFSKLVPDASEFPADPDSCAIYGQEVQYNIGACNAEYIIRKSKLTSINYSGGDTGGGNVEVQYTYTSYNNFKIS